MQLHTARRAQSRSQQQQSKENEGKSRGIPKEREQKQQKNTVDGAAPSTRRTTPILKTLPKTETPKISQRDDETIVLSDSGDTKEKLIQVDEEESQCDSPERDRKTIASQVSDGAPKNKREVSNVIEGDLDLDELVDDDLEIEVDGEIDIDAIGDLTLEEQYMISAELIRNTPEYKAAWELELWKKQEKRKFINSLKVKEKQYLEALREEVQTREEKRKQVLEKQQHNLLEMEQKIADTLLNIKTKEEKLLIVESELRRRKEEIEASYERKLEEMNHTIAMNKNEALHHLEIKQKKNLELEKDNEVLFRRIRDMESQYQQLSKEHHDTCLKINSSDSSLMKGEISKLIIEKDNLKNKLDQCIRSKKNYKTQWKRLLHELNEIKRSHLVDVDKIMKEERRNLTDLKSVILKGPPTVPSPVLVPPTWGSIIPANYTAPSMYPYVHLTQPFSMGKDSTVQEKKELEEIRELKNQLTDLIRKEEEKDKLPLEQPNLQRMGTIPAASPSPSSSTQTTPEKLHIHEHVHKYQEPSPVSRKEYQRLLKERDQLLRTGAYTNNSEIIIQINKKLESLV